MTNEHLPVTTMFREMVSQGHISPVDHMENLRLPGEFVAVPSITTYGTPDMPIRTGVDTDAQLGQRSQRNFTTSGNV
jgi:hypothetical protein